MNCSKLSFELWYELLWGVQEVNVCVSVCLGETGVGGAGGGAHVIVTKGHEWRK